MSNELGKVIGIALPSGRQEINKIIQVFKNYNIEVEESS